jgi:hypothetical protein
MANLGHAPKTGDEIDHPTLFGAINGFGPAPQAATACSCHRFRRHVNCSKPGNGLAYRDPDPRTFIEETVAISSELVRVETRLSIMTMMRTNRTNE